MKTTENKLNELKEAIREDILNGELHIEVYPEVGGWKKCRFKLGSGDVRFSYNEKLKIICYHTHIIENIFKEEDMDKLAEAIDFCENNNKEEHIAFLESKIESFKKQIESIKNS
jgi:hypothetical protein